MDGAACLFFKLNTFESEWLWCFCVLFGLHLFIFVHFCVFILRKVFKYQLRRAFRPFIVLTLSECSRKGCLCCYRLCRLIAVKNGAL